MKKWLPYFILLLFCVPLFLFNIHNFCDWGDDFAQYIKEAQNIATGKPYYQSNYIFNGLNIDFGPPQYSPGFPILLAPVVKIWGIAIRPMLYLETFVLSALLFVLFFYYRKYSGVVTAVCLSIITVYSTSLIDLKQEVLSDIPCFLFVALYLAIRQSKLTVSRRVLLVAIGTFAVLIRAQALMLPVAELVYACLQVIKQVKVTRRFSFTLFFKQAGFQIGPGILLVSVLLSTVVFASSNSTLAYYSLMYRNIPDLWKLLGNNDNYFIDRLQETFYHKTNDQFFQAPANITTYAALTFGLIGFWVSLKKELRVDDVFFILMALLLLLTPTYQGVRYLYPILPVFMLYVKRGMSATLPAALGIKPVKLAVAFTLIYLMLGYDSYEQTTRPVKDMGITPYGSDDTLALNYIKKNISDKDIILFAKPRALTLYTGKRAMVMAIQIPFEQSKRQVDSMGAKYLLYREGLSEPYYKDYLYNTHSNKDSVVINGSFTLYRLRE